MSFAPAWAMCRETLIGHLEVHGVGLYSNNDGLTFAMAHHPPTFGRPLLGSSLFDNGPWTYLETGVQTPAALKPVAWSDISDDMLASLELSQVERLISSTR